MLAPAASHKSSCLAASGALHPRSSKREDVCERRSANHGKRLIEHDDFVSEEEGKRPVKEEVVKGQGTLGSISLVCN